MALEPQAGSRWRRKRDGVLVTVVVCENIPAVGYSVVAWKRPGGKGDLSLGDFLHRYQPADKENPEHG